MPPPGGLSANNGEQQAVEERLLEQLHIAQKAYFEAAAEHKNAIDWVRPGRVKPDSDGSQRLHVAAVSELEALAKYSQAVKALYDAVVFKGPIPEAISALTVREKEVLQLIGEGLSSKQIANRLHIAFRTAVCHRYRIMQKLQVHEVASLVKCAIRFGMIQI